MDLPRPTRRHLLLGTAALAVTGATSAHSAAAAVAAPMPPAPHGRLRTWAADTWTSMVAMAHRSTGLVADNINGDLTAPCDYTSPTNIGGYLWSTLVARDLRLITPGESARRIRQTLNTLACMDKHEPSGMYFNWYEPATGAVLRVWPDNGDKVVPFVSSVDMGWLGAALRVVANADWVNRKRARQLFDSMRWDVFYDSRFGKAGANFGGFYEEDPGRPDVRLMDPLNGVGGPQLYYTINHHYDTHISESRMVTYLGIITGQIPARAYFGTWRSFPPDWTWPEMPPYGFTRTYLGVEVYEGSHTYRGLHVVPGWGGSMFEELMPDMFVDEARWGPKSWGVQHPLHVRAQREHGLDDAKYGYWGFSPSSDPYGGYREYGVDALGLNPEGYFSDEEKTDYHWDNPPTTYGDGVVTPHASFLAMMHEPAQATANLVRIQNTLRGYGPGGFYDAIGTRSGLIAKRYLSLDQAMVLGSIGNVALNNRVRCWFGDARAQRALRPVIALEEFSAGVI